MPFCFRSVAPENERRPERGSIYVSRVNLIMSLCSPSATLDAPSCVIVGRQRRAGLHRQGSERVGRVVIFVQGREERRGVFLPQGQHGEGGKNRREKARKTKGQRRGERVCNVCVCLCEVFAFQAHGRNDHDQAFLIHGLFASSRTAAVSIAVVVEQPSCGGRSYIYRVVK